MNNQMAKTGIIKMREIDFSEMIESQSQSKYKNVFEDIENLAKQYAFEPNTEETREKMCYAIGRYLNLIVIDRTTIEMIDRGTYFFLCRLMIKKFL